VNSVQNQARDYSFDLGPYQKTEIGILECNWSFKTGEGVTIRTEGFQDLLLMCRDGNPHRLEYNQEYEKDHYCPV